MTAVLYRLVYMSRNDITDEIDTQIDGILKTSRENNRLAEVTGALMFNTGCFAQVLEGPHNAIQATFERIQCDERHSDVTVLLFEPSNKRSFSSWAMAYVGAQESALERFGNLGDESGFEFTALDGDDIYNVLLDNLHDAEAQ
ncbi:AppA antirepressor of ppsR sensor of blue light protein [Salinisphaera shabanensis E1L3A]|uniref:AppA antirepressor of ppsR sensor of blue light protein n=1 Tax=Salinisphaera shabanensis E1L3A TaxID=1033802 RepID=F7Q923_9GAMM|nr:BLUF domain-containing protein [Salinisphaera shabanensis]ERJ20103.1 AppA antirepressor of ppsR sensor of blue light protein [Salinisphaera shabanensis E1L3A]